MENQHFDILTLDGNIILPATWNHVIRPGLTVRLVPQALGTDAQRVVAFDAEEDREVRFASPGKHHGRRSDEDNIGGSPVTVRDRSTSPASSRDDSERDEESESDILTETEDESEPPSLPIIVSRTVVEPVDNDRNDLTFLVDQDPSHKQILSRKESEHGEPTGAYGGPDMTSEKLNILKVLRESSDHRMRLQVHTLPSLESSFTNSTGSIHWLHLHASQLDFAQFKVSSTLMPNSSSLICI